MKIKYASITGDNFTCKDYNKGEGGRENYFVFYQYFYPLQHWMFLEMC